MLGEAKRRAYHAALAAGLLAAATIACGAAPPDSPAPAGDAPPVSSQDDRVTWMERSFAKESGNCDTENDALSCTRVQFDWVDVTGAPGAGAAAAINGPIQEWLQRPVFEDDGGTLEQIAAGLQQAHDDLVAEFPDYNLPWYVERNV
ncbi:MAG: hypothetical protein PVJ49_16845, partial [Acidobacteriota bacterium]